jgi:hypothetical protein
MPRDFGTGKTRPDEQVYGMYADAPDVEWTCAMHEGFAILAIQAAGHHTSSHLLARDYKRVETRFIYDPDKLPDLVPQQFIVFADGNMDEPILVTEPDDMLMPVRLAVTHKVSWLLFIQVMVGGQKHCKVLEVQPDWSVVDVGGGELIPHWPIGIV